MHTCKVMATRFAAPHLVGRVASGLGGLFAADLILGMSAFCCITFGSLWYFCIGWVRLQAEYAGVGRAFGSPAQLTLAWVGIFACLPCLLGTLYLGLRAFQLPRGMLRSAVSHSAL
jgi:hypothetical protein